MRTFITKSLLSYLCQREKICPSPEKTGEGRFFTNDVLLMHSIANEFVDFNKNDRYIE